MIKKLAAGLAYELAVGAMNRADDAVYLRDFIWWRGRSRLWSDVEHALRGLGSFAERRAARRNIVKEQAARQRAPFVATRIEGLPA